MSFSVLFCKGSKDIDELEGQLWKGDVKEIEEEKGWYR